MDAIKAAVENMIAVQDWASLIDVITAIMKLVFGIVAEDEDLNYGA